MTDYFIRPKGEGSTQFSIAKYTPDAGALPDDVYYVTINRAHVSCTCPAYKIPCKHIRYVNSWLMLDHPWEYYYDDTIPAFIENPMAIDEFDLEELKKRMGLPKNL